MRQFKERLEEYSIDEAQKSNVISKVKATKICNVENNNFQLNFELCLFERNLEQNFVDNNQSALIK